MQHISKSIADRFHLLSGLDVKNTFKLGTIVLVCILFLTSCVEIEPDNNINTSQEVTKLEVNKSEREMRLYSGSKLIRTMDIGLGFNPVGHKIRVGDGKTPHGRYYIDRKNPYSSFPFIIGYFLPQCE